MERMQLIETLNFEDEDTQIKFASMISYITDYLNGITNWALSTR